jgi:hypothetical protein
MKDEHMTEARLLELIAAFGADPLGFPEVERAAAQELLHTQPERFAAALLDAAQVDAALAGLPDIEPPAALTASLVASSPQARATKRNWLAEMFGTIRIVPATGALASLAIGALIGMNLGAPESADTFEDEAVVYASLGLTDFDAYEEVTQ